MLLPENRSFELTRQLLEGAIDIHVHATPHLPSSPRRLDPIEAATEARDAGMRAIVLMDVFQMTNGFAWIVNRAVRDFTVYGGLNLNTVYGGLNPRAVKTAIGYGDGARFISFGAHSTYYQASREGRIVEGKFTPLKDMYPEFRRQEVDRAIRIPVEGPVGPELDEILSLIADHPHVFLNTGHVSPDEAIRLVELAHEYGIGKVLVATAVTQVASTDQHRYMARRGAFIEYTLGAYTHTTSIPKPHYYVELEYAADEEMTGEASGGIRKAAEQIRQVGTDHCILAKTSVVTRCRRRSKACASSAPAFWTWAYRPRTSARWSGPIPRDFWASIRRTLGPKPPRSESTHSYSPTVRVPDSSRDRSSSTCISHSSSRCAGPVLE